MSVKTPEFFSKFSLSRILFTLIFTYSDNTSSSMEAMEAGSSRVVLADHPPVYRNRVPHNLALAVEKKCTKCKINLKKNKPIKDSITLR